MKILLLAETLTVGGAETFVIRLANALADRNGVVLAVMHGRRVESALTAQLDPRVRLHRLNLPLDRWLWRIDGALRRIGVDWSVMRRLQRRWLRRIVRRERPDSIHSHLLKADRLATEVRGEMAPAPRHIVTMHGDYAPYLGGQADPQMLHASAWMAQVLEGADAVVAVCRDHLEHLASDFPQVRGKVRLIYNGFAAPPGRAPVALPEGKFLFGMVSRGVEGKGWQTAVEAFLALGREDARLVLVGEGPAISRLRALSPSGVIFAGYTPTPLDWIERIDVGLLPTLYPHESLPTAVIEYLACAKPVIATDVGEIGAMLRALNGEPAGLLLPFADGQVRAADLTRAMDALMSDAGLRRRMSRAAQDAFGRFDMARCVKSYEALYCGEAPNSSSTSANH